jgi:hypothetical protein
MSDWQNADRQNIGMYKGFIRLTVVSSTLIIIALVLMAITLL